MTFSYLLLRRNSSQECFCIAVLLKNGVIGKLPTATLQLGKLPKTKCELNRWMQHHLTEIICFRGGVYESRKTVWSFFGPEDRDLAPLEGGRVVT
jgi:hypothetical protein